MQDYLFRDPVVVVKCQAFTGAAAATVRDKGVCGVRGGEAMEWLALVLLISCP